MFDKKKFSEILTNINNTYSTMTKFSQESNVNRTYFSQYINLKLENPPSPKVLLKIAHASHEIVSYEELMEVCGYSHNNFNTIKPEKEFYICPIYQQISLHEPYLLDKNVIGRIVLDYQLYHITNPEECFFFQTLNKQSDKKNIYNLFHKQNTANIGDTVLVILKDKKTMIKKYTVTDNDKQNYKILAKMIGQIIVNH